MLVSWLKMPCTILPHSGRACVITIAVAGLTFVPAVQRCAD